MTRNQESTVTALTGGQEVMNSEAFRFEQINSLFRQLWFIYLADIAASCFLLLILAATAYSPWTFLWCGAIIALTSCRALVSGYLHRHYAAPAHNRLRGRFLLAGAISSGLLWGSILLALPADTQLFHISLAGLWLAGLSAGAATTMSMLKEVFFGFVLSACISFLGLLFVIAPGYFPVFLASIGIYLTFIIPITMHIGRDFNNAIKLKLQNQKLQQQLEVEAIRLQELEAELLTQLRKQATLQSQKAHIDEKLKAADEDRLLILDAVQEGIYGVSNQGTITFINPSALGILGFAEADVLGGKASDLINPVDIQRDNSRRANEAISVCYRSGVSTQLVESLFTGKDGRVFPVRFSCEPIKKRDKVIGAVVSFVDISKQKEMEFMLIQSQKMEAIGRLTGGVSHDFNNLLTVIMGNLQFLQRKISNDDDVSALLGKIMTAAKNGAELNNRLLSFSREQALETSPTNIRQTLLEMSEFLDRILGEEIRLELDLMEQDCIVMTDPTQLENAILNLCVNAKDAMPQGGTLSMVARTSHLPESFIGHNLSNTEVEYIELQVSDTGTGIPESIQRQIFEPFFTTKEKNRGTGLGLSTVYNFLRQSGGNITVQSESGSGTTFNLYLPVSGMEVTVENTLEELKDAASAYSGTVLVVEDDDNVREVAYSMLVDSGFDVLTAANGPTGLETFKAHPEIDLVFTDVIMPGGMTGIEMAEEILQLRPDMPILLTTGYTEKSIKDRVSGLPNIICVSKPYDTIELPKYVNGMMRKSSRSEEKASI